MSRPDTPWSSDLAPQTMLACGVLGYAVALQLGPALSCGLKVSRITALIFNLTIQIVTCAVLLTVLYRHRRPEQSARESWFRRLKKEVLAILGGVIGVKISNIVITLLWKYLLDSCGFSYAPKQWVVNAAPGTQGAVFWLLCVYTIVTGPLVEELIFRRMLYGALLSVFPAWAAVVVTNLAFSVIHGYLLGLPALFAMGVCFHIVYLYTRHLGAAVIVHGMANAIVFAPLIAAKL